MSGRIIRFIPLVAWTSTVLWLSLQSNPPTIDLSLAAWDKFQHAAAYAVLTLLAGVAFQGLTRRPLAPWVAAFVFAVAFGALVEVAQGVLTAVRAPEWGDLLADLVGAALVLAAAWWRKRGAP